MSLQDLNNATAALNALHQRSLEQLNTWDQEVAVRQAAYDALAANLKGVVKSEMDFIATVDPDEAAPTNVDGGTFNNIVDAINAAPAGGEVALNLLPGKTYPLGTSVNLRGRGVVLKKATSGVNPVLAPAAFSSATVNTFAGFGQSLGGRLRMSGIDVALPAKNDPALPWGQGRSLVTYMVAGATSIDFSNGTITGDEGQALLSGFAGTQCRASLYNCTFDGPIFAVRDVGSSVATIVPYLVTLSNGAALTSDGTPISGNYIEG